QKMMSPFAPDGAVAVTAVLVWVDTGIEARKPSLLSMVRPLRLASHTGAIEQPRPPVVMGYWYCARKAMRPSSTAGWIVSVTPMTYLQLSVATRPPIATFTADETPLGATAVTTAMPPSDRAKPARKGFALSTWSPLTSADQAGAGHADDVIG